MDVFCAFGGPIDQNAIQRFFRSMPPLMESPDVRLHLLLQTVGGYVGDGVCLYNFFRHLPCPVTAYNIGNISSIGVIAFLGAPIRRCSENATFMIHRSTMTTELPTADRLQAAVRTLTMDDERTGSILRQHLTLTDAQWHELNHNDLTLSAREALEIGLVHALADFAPPKGAKVHPIV